MEEYSLILLSGGIGTRMQRPVPKQFLLVGGKPIIVHVLEKIDGIDEIKEIIIPSPPQYIEKTLEIIKSFRVLTPVYCIEGGRTRQESVYKALQEVSHADVIIHEAVRPFVTREEFLQLMNFPSEAAIYGTDIPFTVLEGVKFVERNLDRNRLVNVQLPQKFKTEKLKIAHEYARQNNLHYTEDASLYFDYFQSNIDILQGSDYNIKITKPIDLLISEIIYKEYILAGSHQ